MNMGQSKRFSTSNGIKKAAVLLVSVGQEAASKVMGELDEEAIRAVSEEIAKLGTVTAEEQGRVMEEFYQMSVAKHYVQQGGIEYARRLLRKSVSGEDADRIVRSVEQALHSAPFSFASKTESQNLLTFVQDEQPQTIALILSHLSGAQAAEVLKGLPRGKQLEVVRRMASMETTNPEVIHEVEASLEKRMASVVTQKFEPSGGVERVAEVLNLTDRATERDILDGLAQENPELVEEIRKRMFVFEDILLVDDKGVQQVLKEIDAQELSLSLKTASDEVKEKFFRNMSERAVRLVLEEMEYMGPVRLGQVDAGQQRIAEVVRRLEEDGEVSVRGRSGEEEVVV
jgi:flagellar motor switch protein FliG